MSSTMSTTERDRPKYLRYPDGGWATEYQYRNLRAVSRATAENKNAKWAVYEVTGNSPETTKETLLAEGSTRDRAVFKAMDKIDEDDPSKPLRHQEQAAWWIKVVTMAFPAAVGFDAVRNGEKEIIGWTFFVEKGAKHRFGWVAVDRRRAQTLEDDRDQAAQSLVATVGMSTAEHLASPAQATAEATGPREVKQGSVIAALPVEPGTCPRYTETPAVHEALTALGKFLPENHPRRMRLAEVTDRYEIRDRETHPAAARGALVLPEEGDVTGSRVYAYWLEDGEWFRPGDVAATVPLQGIAERLSQAGFAIESIRDARVSLLHHTPDAAGGAAATEYTDVWTLSNRSGFEVAVIECRSDDALMNLAQCLPHVRATIQNEGGIVRRRLSQWEIHQRGAAGDDPAEVAVHHCEERGHSECGRGTRLVNLDPQNNGRILPAPTNPVEAVDRGNQQLPTYVKGTLLLGIDGTRHTVWETVWRQGDDKVVVETVITAAGEEHRVEQLVQFEGGERRMETAAHKGDTAAERSPILGRTPMADICPTGHLNVMCTVEALGRVRTGREEDREQWEMAAEETALWAAAWFYQATGELTVDAWRTVVRCAVELHGCDIGRTHVNPEPERNGFFGAGRRSLEKCSPEGFKQILEAGRHWAYSLEHPQDTAEREQADRAMWKAAGQFAAALGTQDANEWITPVRYLAELHAMALVEEAAAQYAQSATDRPRNQPDLSDTTAESMPSITKTKGPAAPSPITEDPIMPSLSRFYSTPEEIHAFLTEHLAEDVYLRYQQVIGAAAVREAAEGLREEAQQQRARAAESGPLGSSGEEDAEALTGAADAMDPDQDGGPWPSVLVRHFRPRGRVPAEPVIRQGALRAHGRCEEQALRGTDLGVCDRPLDSLGRCVRPSEHVGQGDAVAGDAQ